MLVSIQVNLNIKFESCYGSCFQWNFLGSAWFLIIRSLTWEMSLIFLSTLINRCNQAMCSVYQIQSQTDHPNSNDFPLYSPFSSSFTQASTTKFMIDDSVCSGTYDDKMLCKRSYFGVKMFCSLLMTPFIRPFLLRSELHFHHNTSDLCDVFFWLDVRLAIS